MAAGTALAPNAKPSKNFFVNMLVRDIELKDTHSSGVDLKVMSVALSPHFPDGRTLSIDLEPRKMKLDLVTSKEDVGQN